MDMAIRTITRLWPHAMIEDAVTGEAFDRYADVTFAGRQEILVFRDAKAARLWDEIGPDPSLDGTLVHLLISGNQLTVTVDAEPNAQIRVYVAALQRSLGQDLFASGRRAA